MRAMDKFWMIIGAFAAIVFLIRQTTPGGLSEEMLQKMVEIQPILELTIILMCLWFIVPRAFSKMKNQTIYDILVWSCFIIGCGVATLMFTEFIPADTTTHETDSLYQLYAYGLVGAFMVCHLGWESHKAKRMKKLNEQRKAESELVHQKAMEESK